jgi:hypothetical protein
MYLELKKEKGGIDIDWKTYSTTSTATSLQNGTLEVTNTLSESRLFSAQLWISPSPLAAPPSLFFWFISVSSANAAIVVVENIPVNATAIKMPVSMNDLFIANNLLVSLYFG